METVIEGVRFMITVAFIWFIWLWFTQPKWEDGEYVCFTTRIRKALKRLLSGSDKG